MTENDYTELEKRSLNYTPEKLQEEDTSLNVYETILKKIIGETRW